jgi:hypothetical protein
VILLFYLLVTPAVVEMGLPRMMAGVFFLFPIIFFLTLFWTRYKNRPIGSTGCSADGSHRSMGLFRSGV